MTLFREVVESKIEDPRGRLTRLIKYTTGEAIELIKHCIELPSKIGYEKALHLLYKRYGDHHTTLAAYRKEIREWPQIKPGDATAFRKFYNFLIKCQSIIGESKWNVLDSPDTICMLLAKLPNHMRDGWNREVYSIRSRQSREPELSDLINFIDKETILVNDPLFSREAVDYYVDKKERPERKKRIRSYTTKTEEIHNTNLTRSGKNCLVCDGSHDLDNCKEFMSQELKDRIKLLYKNKLCYGCYQGI